MAEEGGSGAATGVPSATDHEFTSHNHQSINIAHIPPFNQQSRRSTLSKSGFDMHISGTATPMTGGKRDSKHINELDEYFVGPIHSYYLN